MVGGDLAVAGGGEAFGLVAVGAFLQLGADGAEEGLEVGVEVLGRDAEVPVEEKEQLFFHQVDLREGEAEGVVAAHGGVAGPVLVLGGGVVEVLGGEDEGGEEDAVHGAAHAFGHGREPGLQPGEVDEGGHERGNLDVRAVDERLDELFQRWEGRGSGRCWLAVGRGSGWWCGWEVFVDP